MQNKKFKAVIFDKDGVLIDSMESCLRASNETLKHYGHAEMSEEEFRKSFWGVRADINIAKIFKGLSESKIKEIHEYYKRKKLEFKELIKLYPSTVPVLEELKGRKKYKLAVVTSTSKDVAVKILQSLDVLKYFEIVVGGHDTVYPKPAPDPILKACELLKVKPKQTVYIGDTMHDIVAAKAAGCTTVIVTTSLARKELEKIDGIIVIDDLKEVLKIA